MPGRSLSTGCYAAQRCDPGQHVLPRRGQRQGRKSTRAQEEAPTQEEARTRKEAPKASQGQAEGRPMRAPVKTIAICLMALACQAAPAGAQAAEEFDKYN